MKHISPSQLNMFFRCGEQYRRRYIEKEIIQPGFALHRGKGVHGGAEVNNTQKITTHEDLPASQIKEAAAAAYNESVSQGCSLTKEEQSRGLDIIRGEYLDQTVSLAELWATKAARLSQPTHVEHKVEIEINDSYELLGFIDMIDEAGYVVDIKTGKRRSQSDLDRELQFTFYSLAYRAIIGSEAKGVAIDQLITNKTLLHERAMTVRSKEDYQILVNRINLFIRHYELGNFVPASPMSWWCDEQWCGYANTCQYYSSKRSV